MALLSKSTIPYRRHDINIHRGLQRYHANRLIFRGCKGMILEPKGLKVQEQLLYGGVKRPNCLDDNYVHGKRGNLLVAAASAPTEDVAVTTEPLTKQDLVAYLASGCKPKDKWRIGTEHEKFGFERKTLQPMNYEQISELLQGLAERFGWDKVMEGDFIIGLKQDNQSISLEPGGQFELSGAPLETLHQTCAEVNSHLYQVKAVAEEMGIGFLGIGFQPKWELKDIPIMPKGRYNIMRNYMPKVGTLGLDMMFRTCTVQANLDFSSEIDMVRKFRAGLALQPIATALFANSPFTEGKPNGFLSYRSHIWTDTDNNRSGMLPFVFDDSFGMPPLPAFEEAVTQRSVGEFSDLLAVVLVGFKDYSSFGSHTATGYKPDGEAEKILGDERCRWRSVEKIVCLASIMDILMKEAYLLISSGSSAAISKKLLPTAGLVLFTEKEELREESLRNANWKSAFIFLAKITLLLINPWE
ncbi:hypothetical protein KI387_020432 [Taxus chinensis]|uniref:glutamate--cysteine ligase n=1 Tax=Taxus chinensis TaxID=29808 RepID=A0AA38LBG9_TAXCH|nr:hypothetical protein KI387_020432 [Taxus chinensis]